MGRGWREAGERLPASPASPRRSVLVCAAFRLPEVEDSLESLLRRRDSPSSPSNRGPERLSLRYLPPCSPTNGGAEPRRPPGSSPGSRSADSSSEPSLRWFVLSTHQARHFSWQLPLAFSIFKPHLYRPRTSRTSQRGSRPRRRGGARSWPDPWVGVGAAAVVGTDRRCPHRDAASRRARGWPGLAANGCQRGK